MNDDPKDLKNMPDDFWKKKLTPEQYKVLREAGTEPAFTGKFVDNHDDGMYHCAACSAPLFLRKRSLNLVVVGQVFIKLQMREILFFVPIIVME